MIARRLLRHISRLLVVTLLFAHALISTQAYARFAGPAGDEAVVVEEHCHEAVTEPVAPSPQTLVCKHHCLSALQTLDHPDTDVAATAPAAALTIPTTLWKPLVGAALRPSLVPNAGAPPPLALTARLRI